MIRTFTATLACAAAALFASQLVLAATLAGMVA